MTTTEGTSTTTPRWIEYLRLDDLAERFDERNAKGHDIDELRVSLGRFGYTAPIEIDERTGKLAAGHGRTELLLLEHESGEVDLPEGLMVADDGMWLAPVVRGWRSENDDEAEAYLVASNHLVEAGGWIDSALLASLDRINATDLGLRGTGYDVDELRALAAKLDADSGGELHEAQTYEQRFSVDDIVEQAAAHYEAQGFPYPEMPLHEMWHAVERLALCDIEQLAATPIGGGVADVFHPHRWAVRVDGAAGSPVDAFSNPKLLRHALRNCLEMGGNVTARSLRSALGWVRGHQAAANFRPGFALRAIREHCPPGGVVLDTSTGFGGRLVGFAASTAGLYVGIDPSTATVAGNRQLAEALRVDKRVQLIEQPAEDVNVDDVPTCDMAITSPPYFGKERYADEPTQSWVRYGDAEAWRVGFLLPMMRLQFAALRPGGVSVVNIADVDVGGVSVPLVAWTIAAAAEVGFERLTTQLVYALGRVPGAGDRGERFEPVLVFRRPS